MTIVRFTLGLIVIVGIIVSKYLQIPEVVLIVMALTSLLYLRTFYGQEIINNNFMYLLIKLSHFIIIIGIFGFIIVKIMGVFLDAFD